MNLTTVDRVKKRLELNSAKDDSLLVDIITGVSAAVEQYLGRHVESKARTEQYDIEPLQQILFLKGFPVSASPAAAFKNDLTREFTVAAIGTSSYYLNLDRGIVKFDQISMTYGPGVLQAVYTGGMAATVNAFLTAYPDVASAVEQQVAYEYKRRDLVGVDSLSTEGGSVSMEDREGGLLASVRQRLSRHRRAGVVFP